jgi:16S rRNA (cytosine1402-N4)-methyltransferase
MKTTNDPYHQPVLLQESIDGLNIQPNGTYVDCTFGGGGHSKAILNQLKNGQLVAFDQDADAVNNIPKNKKLLFVAHNFRFIRQFLRYHNIEKVDGILADLGVSSHQFDDAERGFTFRSNARLDMRMNTESSKSAYEVINTYTKEELKRIFKEYGELKNAGQVANYIVSSRATKALETSGELCAAIEKLTRRDKENQFFAKVFQAIRIEVNNEIECLKELLMHSIELIDKGGRISIISYHSLEDRLVKNFIRWGNFDKEPEKDVFGNYTTPFKATHRNVIIPSNQEIEQNNRARSAKLRIAERV